MNRRLYVGNLPVSMTDADLRARFELIGKVESAVVLRDAGSGRSKRCGVVEMASQPEARAALERLNMTQYEDMVISVRVAPAEMQLR